MHESMIITQYHIDMLIIIILLASPRTLSKPIDLRCMWHETWWIKFHVLSAFNNIIKNHRFLGCCYNFSGHSDHCNQKLQNMRCENYFETERLTKLAMQMQRVISSSWNFLKPLNDFWYLQQELFPPLIQVRNNRG